MLRTLWRSVVLPVAIVTVGATPAFAQLSVSRAIVLHDSASAIRDSSAVAFGADTFAATWQVGPPGSHDIAAAVIAGRAFAPTGSRPSLSVMSDDEIAPGIAFTGTAFLAGWRDALAGGPSSGGPILFSTFNADGTTRTASGMVNAIPGGELGPALACDGLDHCLAVWQSQTLTDVDLRAVIVNTTSGIGTVDVTLTPLPSSVQTSPAVA